MPGLNLDLSALLLVIILVFLLIAVFTMATARSEGPAETIAEIAHEMVQRGRFWSALPR